MTGFTNRQRRRLQKPFALILEPFADVPREERPRTRVLDFPAGVGCTSFALRAAGFDVTPCDLFPETFRRSHERMRALGGVEDTPQLFATTDATVAQVAAGATRYAGSVAALLPAK